MTAQPLLCGICLIKFRNRKGEQKGSKRLLYPPAVECHRAGSPGLTPTPHDKLPFLKSSLSKQSSMTRVSLLSASQLLFFRYFPFEFTGSEAVNTKVWDDAAFRTHTPHGVRLTFL